MITIGYISDIKNGDVYVTYSHVDKNICFHTEPNYNIGDIVAVELETKFDPIIETVCNNYSYEEIVGLQSIHNIDTSIIKYIYSYQDYLFRIAFDNYCTDVFFQKIKSNGISSILYEKFLDTIISSDSFQYIVAYVSDTDISELIDKRNVSLYDITDKYGDYIGSRIECTDFGDSYINSFLHIIGSYSPICVNNSPKQLPGETYMQAVNRTINSTATNAKKNYSKVEHLSRLLKEVLLTKQLYESEKNRIHKEAEKYLGYSFAK